MAIAYLDKVNVNPEAFRKKLEAVSANLGIHPSWLMIAIWIESRLNRKAVNASSGAVGLIQWLPSYVYKLLGLPNVKWLVQQRIKNMSGVEQLDLIQKFLMPYRGRMTDQYQTYLAIFSPAALGKPESYLIAAKDVPGKRQAYEWNQYLDTKFGNKDGKITLFDIKKFVDAHTPAGTDLKSVNHHKTTYHHAEICRCCGRPI